jgi:hypothetical protein
MNYLFLIALYLSCVTVSAQDLMNRPQGLVPDEQTAVRIAEAVLIPIYGEKTIRAERPYVVKLIDMQWIITGSLGGTSASPTSTVIGGDISSLVGGTFHITISRKDARIIEIGHGA